MNDTSDWMTQEIGAYLSGGVPTQVRTPPIQTPAGQSLWQKLRGALADPDVQQFLMQMGGAIGEGNPFVEGLAGAAPIMRAATARKALGKARTGRESRLGGLSFTPPDQEGLTKITEDQTGIKMDITKPTAAGGATPSQLSTGWGQPGGMEGFYNFLLALGE